MTGAEGMAFTVKVNVATAEEHGEPSGLFVVTVIKTVLPLSELPGVYVKLKEGVVADEGLTVPAPFSVIVTLVALPLKVFPETVTAVVPQVVSLVALRITAGALTQPHETPKIPVVVTHPAEFRTPR